MGFVLFIALICRRTFQQFYAYRCGSAPVYFKNYERLPIALHSPLRPLRTDTPLLPHLIHRRPRSNDPLILAWMSAARARFCSTLQGRFDSACSRTDGFHPGPFEPLLRPVPSHLRGKLSLMPPGAALAALTARARRPLILVGEAPRQSMHRV